MKPKAYIETTIVSYLTARPSRDVIVAGRQALTLEWWSSCRDSFEVFVSSLVVSECEEGDPEAAARRLQIIEGVSTLQVSDEALSLGHELVQSATIPERSAEDALHVAICAVNAIDYLVTWNCAHLANAFLRRKVEQVVSHSGYLCPIICTPEEMMEG